jgi:hypothetical protein
MQQPLLFFVSLVVVLALFLVLVGKKVDAKI